MKRNITILSIAAGLLSAPSEMRGDSFSLTWSAVSSNGTAALNGGAFSLTASVAQPSSTSTALSGNGFSITAGYWSSPIPSCDTMPGDLNGDGRVDGLDVQALVQCVVDGAGNCGCADVDENGIMQQNDVKRFVSRLLGTF